MSLKPTLYYLDARARAETIRFILKLKGVKFNDVRLKEIPADLKARTSFGQVPFYEDKDISLSQSLSIESYLSEIHGLAGYTTVERALISQFVHATQDVYNPYFRANDEASNTKFRDEIAPKFLTRFQQHLKAAGGEHFVGGRLTHADISVFALLDYFHQQTHNNLPEVLAPFTLLESFYNKIASIPEIAEHLQTRPKTRL
ncbi:hypothetical protein PPL_07385 [Heterostelium album PN500]|uniref:Glutathione S-transferase n=1 Tax=Heterostelium pallidum (strain ATCC 26659 / Pp 5 / PN500) TaxID=670386 RepID=D3BFT4_HETP5|nr:hypothetical protein PPL_07385 [Heterostelium album PN500]EFA79694.1 hypothetical protein PPL_07385 [Heterostelium album PN500]|eukprot:XP_020431815.1 hypothetical protein PPL_07385 [Heterostelium album PN500]